MKSMIDTIRTARRTVRRAMSRRVEKPRLLAYATRRMVETGGCGIYYKPACGNNHSGNTGPGCGHYYSSSCGANHSGN